MFKNLPSVIRALQKNPTQVLTAIKTIDVGVATFSLTLNNRHRTEKEQMSTPLPAKALNVPPITPTKRILFKFWMCFWSGLNDHLDLHVFLYKPVTINRKGSHHEIFWIVSNVLRLCCLLRRNNAKAKLNHILTNPSFFVAEANSSSITSNPSIIPNTPPKKKKGKKL